MSLFKPHIYKKNIHKIDYKKLQKQGIRCLIFDLDNTLGLITDSDCPKETVKLIEKLKKDFLVVIISNNNLDRIKIYLDQLDIDGFAKSAKPTTKGLRRIEKKYCLKKNEMVIIGDQMVTDILAGKLFRIKTILVDPLGDKDLKITYFNRFLERRIMKRYLKKGVFERGKYYE